MNERVRVFANKQLWNSKIELLIGNENHAAEVTFAAVPKHALREPSLTIDIAAAQELMDQLWMCGLRPSEGTGSAGSLAATERHLNDMRKIAFNQLKIEE